MHAHPEMPRELLEVKHIVVYSQKSSVLSFFWAFPYAKTEIFYPNRP